MQAVAYHEIPNKKIKNLTGKRFGWLVVLGLIYHRGSRSQKFAWHCKCDCGGFAIVRGAGLKNGITKGCPECKDIRAGASLQRHGYTKKGQWNSEYRAWMAMRVRCLNPKSKNYHQYGGRGITICERWLVGDGAMTAPECFLLDMGKKPTPRHSLDRIDNNGSYSPENCRWATRITQLRNRRCNSMVEFNGRMVCMAELSEITGISISTLYHRRKMGRPLTSPWRVL